MPPRTRESFSNVQEEGNSQYGLQSQHKRGGHPSSRSCCGSEVDQGANPVPPLPRRPIVDSATSESIPEMRQQTQSTRGPSLWRLLSRRVLPPESVKRDLPPRTTSTSQKQASLVLQPKDATQKQEKSKTPHQTWYYSSNHVLVNRERLANGLAPLKRSVVLDEKARQVAELAASGKDLKEVIPEEETENFVSGNVLVGDSIRSIHCQMLVRDKCHRERINMFNPNFKELGMGTYKDPNTGLLYLCQLFGTGEQ